MDMQEHTRRRRALMRTMGADAIAVIPAAPQVIRSRDVEYPYRQDSDLLYLTGFDEPDAVAVLLPEREQGEFVLFVRERDPEREGWNGSRAGVEGAVERFGADDAFPIGDIDDILPGLLEGRTRVFCTMGRYPEFDRRILGWANEGRRARTGGHAPGEFIALEYYLHEMRLFKSRAEMRAMRRAARISMAAHERAMDVCRAGVAEQAVEAEFWYEFRRNGGEPAYSTIVGGGANACVLHYVDNTDTLRAGEMVLIDGGCEWGGYAGDITRTYPVDGQFTEAGRAVHDIVCRAQQAALAQCLPGNHWNDPHEAAVAELTAGLVELGLLAGPAAERVADASYQRFYMHRTGHWLGMDVHDVGDYRIDGEWRELEPGMCLTVEPGLYIPPTDDIPEHLRGIGVRIEDDVHITRDGAENLTADLPKTAAEIEARMQAQ